MYRIGLPGWKIAAKLGVPIAFRVRIHKDQDSGTYWADSPDLDGLVVSGANIDELHREVCGAADCLLDAQLSHKPSKAVADFQVSVCAPA
jgi:predicted RNase H-like HicB family nuclease